MVYSPNIDGVLYFSFLSPHFLPSFRLVYRLDPKLLSIGDSLYKHAVGWK